MSERRNYFAQLWLIALMLLSLPLLTNYLLSPSEISVQDFSLALVLVVIESVIVAGLIKFALPHRLSGLLAVIVLSLLVGNHYTERLTVASPLFRVLDPLPELGYAEGPIYSLILLGLLTWLSIVIGRWMTQRIQYRGWAGQKIAEALTLAITIAFLLQLVPTLNRLLPALPQFFYQPAPLAIETTVRDNKRPDIYYIVLDRYTNQPVLAEQFQFDNTPFLNALKDQGLIEQPNAYSPYPYTTMSVAATLAADYHSALVERFGRANPQTIIPYHRTIRYSPVVRELKTLGYHYHLLGSWYEATNQSPFADRSYNLEGVLHLGNRQITLDSLAKKELDQSPLLRAVSPGLSYNKRPALLYQTPTRPEQVLDQLETLNRLAKEPAGGRLIFAHILSPHDPYSFNADGSLATESGTNNLDRPIKQKYLDQVAFLNHEITQLVTTINEQSAGQAIIILQADEGPYPMQLNQENFSYRSVGNEIEGGNMLKWSDIDLKMKFGTLAAYRIPQATAEEVTEAGDAVNVFRLIFNTYFGTNLPYQPDCHYGYENGKDRAFVYTEISQRLTGQTNSACPIDSRFTQK